MNTWYAFLAVVGTVIVTVALASAVAAIIMFLWGDNDGETW